MQTSSTFRFCPTASIDLSHFANRNNQGIDAQNRMFILGMVCVGKFPHNSPPKSCLMQKRTLSKKIADRDNWQVRVGGRPVIWLDNRPAEGLGWSNFLRMGNEQWTNLLLAWCLMGGGTCAECNSCTFLNGINWIHDMGVGCLRVLVWGLDIAIGNWTKMGWGDYRQCIWMLQLAELLRKKLNNDCLQWLCYLSTTGVYGDYGGAWVDEK
ncbi:hypothetical protein E3N88_02564 [Mikania micrantha]|uniref:Uncharacterized protein n=1 Tax=Mikania micrantha TaxID=192012 RepID=A0A5N6Q6D4_9ASTR|nr:hypothetical protein E3N88_02564 [Mikania micrantha]